MGWGAVVALVITVVDAVLTKAPPKNIGAKSDTEIDINSLGNDLPTVNGRNIVKGHMVWLQGNELIEFVSKKKYGGGLSGTTTVKSYKYFATAAFALGEAAEGATITRLWFGPDLVQTISSDYKATSYAETLGLTGIFALALNVWRSIHGKFFDRQFYFFDGSQTQPHELMTLEQGANAPAYTGTMMVYTNMVPLADYGNIIPELYAEIISDPNRGIEFIESKTIEDPYGASNFPSAPRYLTFEEQLIVSPSWSNDYPLNATYTVLGGDIENRVFYSPQSEFTRPDTVYIPPTGLNDNKLIHPYYQDVNFSGVDSIVSPNGMYNIRNEVLAYAGRNLSANEYRIYYSAPEESPIHIVKRCYALCLSRSGDYLYILTEDFVERYDSTLTLDGFIAHGVTLSSNAFGGAHLWHDNDKLYYCDQTDGEDVYVYKEDLSALIFSDNLPAIGAGSPTGVGIAVDSGILIRSYDSTDDTQIIIEKYIVEGNDGTDYSLEDLVEAIGARRGLTIDASELSGITYHGINTGSESARAYIEELQSVYLFDVIQDGYNVKAIKREGKTPSETIYWDDLGATSGTPSGSRYSYDWEEELKLPHKLALSYIDPEIEYERNVQYAAFPTRSIDELRVETHLVLLPDEAAQLADKLIKFIHIERQNFTDISIPQTYLGIKPSDVYTLETDHRNYTVRITEVTETREQILKCKAVVTDATIYESTAVGLSGFVPNGIMRSLTEATFHLIDAPMLADDQDTPSFLSAMWGLGYWAGGDLWRSEDGGASYTTIQGFQTGVTIGYAIDVLTQNDGFLIDTETTFNIRPASGTFPALNDIHENEGIVIYGADGRWEIMQYTTATVESDDTVTLSGLLRGRKGTEWATGLHAFDDAVILFDPDELHLIGENVLNINKALSYVGVTSGKEDFLATTDESEFTYGGVNLKPLSAVHGYTTTLSGDGSVDIYFTPRTRFDNTDWWTTGATVTTEPTESYEVDVLDGPDGTVLRTLTGSSIPIRYTGDQQTTDFGSPPADIDFKVYQLNAVVGRGFAYEFNDNPPDFDQTTWLTTHDTVDTTYSADGLTATGRSNIATCITSIGQSTNSFVWQIVVGTSVTGVSIGAITQTRATAGFSNAEVGAQTGGWSFRPDGSYYVNGTYNGSGSITYAVGDVLTLFLDTSADTLKITRNNNEANRQLSITTSGEKMYPVCSGAAAVTYKQKFTITNDTSLMTWASTLHPGVHEIGYYE